MSLAKADDQKTNVRRGAHLALILSMILMGTAYVGAKFALRGAGPFTTAFFRFLIANLIMWPLLFSFKRYQANTQGTRGPVDQACSVSDDFLFFPAIRRFAIYDGIQYSVDHQFTPNHPGFDCSDFPEREIFNCAVGGHATLFLLAFSSFCKIRKPIPCPIICAEIF